jgi:antitoxin VapB
VTENIEEELKQKRERVLGLLERERLDAVLIARHENIAWLTAGRVDVRIGVLRETGAASLLLTKANAGYYLTTNNEAPRLANEEFAGLEWQPLVKPWYANDLAASIEELVPDGIVGADAPFAGLRNINLQPLRYELTLGEVERYRWLGKNTAAVATEVLLATWRGMSERHMQAMLAERLIDREILPSVYLTAVDNRIRNYRHAVPRQGVLDRFGMLNFCARRWGLSVSMTRFVHFGPMPSDLESKFSVVAGVNAALQSATQEGVSANALLSVARDAYAAAGHAGEETMHHQGGAAGYLEREWVARPGGTEVCGHTQAFAWNPSLDGAKVEDTILLCDGSMEVLTATPELPLVETRFEGASYHSAGVLIASA